MSWGSVGFPSPSMRRTSRPLSMICENPDDSTGNPKVKANNKINGKVEIQGDGNENPRLSPKLSKAIPTRRKAVAPLQHPIVILLDNNSDSINNSNDSSLSLNHKKDQKRIQIPETTSTVSSIIKRFSSMGSVNTTSNNDDNNNIKRGQRFLKVSLPHNSKEVTTNICKSTTNTYCDPDPGITSDNVNSPEGTDRNHNNVCRKSANISHGTEFNELSSKSSDSVDASPSMTCENMVIKGNNRVLNSTADISMDKDELRISQNNDDNNSNVLQNASAYESDMDMSLCSESSRNITQDRRFQLLKKDECDACNNNHINNNNDQGFSHSIDRTQDEDQILHLYNTPNNTSTNNLEHRDEDATHSRSIKIIQHREGRTVFHSPDDSYHEDNNFPFLTSTPNFKTKPSDTPSFETPLHHENHSPLQNIQNTLKPTEDVLQTITDISEPEHPPHISDDNAISDSEMKLLSNPAQQADSTSILDGETLEWKKRVKRSVSLIKVPSASELTVPKRRISHSPNHHFETNSENEQSLYNNYINRNTHNTTFSTISQQNNDVGAIDQSNRSTEPVRRISAIDQSDFSLLKIATTRLNLPTRRPSVTAWKEKYLDKNGPTKFLKSNIVKENLNSSGDGDKVCGETESSETRTDNRNEWKITEDVENRINESLAWLRKELIDIRISDQLLARQFLNLREAMNAFRLAVECEDHQELIKDAEEDMEEIRELSQLVDIPPGMLSPLTPLKHVGITRMNISSRRFSTC